jgi:hypothetical protein
MTISYVGSAAAEATSVTLPTHQAGDLLIMFAMRAANGLPTIPSGWFLGGSRTSSSGISLMIAWKVAASSSETSGTWTNAAAILSVVYRHTSNYLVIGGISINPPSSTTAISYPLMLGNNNANFATILRAASSVMAAGVWSLANNATIETVPMYSNLTPSGSSLTLRNNSVLATYESAWFDTGTPISGTTGGNATSNIATTTMATSVEILDTGLAKSSGGGFRAVNIRGGADQ